MCQFPSSFCLDWITLGRGSLAIIVGFPSFASHLPNLQGACLVPAHMAPCTTDTRGLVWCLRTWHHALQPPGGLFSACAHGTVHYRHQGACLVPAHMALCTTNSRGLAWCLRTWCHALQTPGGLFGACAHGTMHYRNQGVWCLHCTMHSKYQGACAHGTMHCKYQVFLCAIKVVHYKHGFI